MSNVVGLFAATMSVVSIMVSVVPGAMSLIGLLVSLIALVCAVFSVEAGKRKYFTVNLSMEIIGVLLVNDSLRVWGSFPDIPTSFKAMAYGISGVIVLGCVVAASSRYKK